MGFNLWFLESRLRPATFLHGLLQEIHNDFDWNQFALLEAGLMGPKLAATTGLLEEYPYFFLVLACMSLLRVMFYCFRIRWISSDQDSLFNKTTSSLLGVFVETLCPTLM